jgi:hypothetical protein
MLKSRLAHLCGEAVTLWRLERAKNTLHCFIVEPPGGYWLAVERGADLVFSETHRELDPALMRAESLKSPLIVAGWTAVADH